MASIRRNVALSFCSQDVQRSKIDVIVMSEADFSTMKRIKTMKIKDDLSAGSTFSEQYLWMNDWPPLVWPALRILT